MPVLSTIGAMSAQGFGGMVGGAGPLLITYHVVGAGGGGGGAGRNDSAGTGGSGGASSISGAGFSTITANGGGGGTGGARLSDVAGGDTINLGGAGVTIGGVERGAGGDSAFNQLGGDDTELSGGGGGGAGGAGISDPHPLGGDGGSTGSYATGTLELPKGTIITVSVGTGGARGLNYLNNNYAGGSSLNDNAQAGGNGFVRLTIDGVNYDFTSSGTHTV